jgi:predicted RNA binding protein YcfA (HicA-like mRNA interferase family)
MRLPQISGLEIIKILNKSGFLTVRQRGSHVRLEKITNEKTIKLTVPMHERLKKGTLLSIIKASEVNKEEFERFF